MWHTHLARGSRAGRPCHFGRLHHIFNVHLLDAGGEMIIVLDNIT